MRTYGAQTRPYEFPAAVAAAAAAVGAAAAPAQVPAVWKTAVDAGVSRARSAREEIGTR